MVGRLTTGPDQCGPAGGIFPRVRSCRRAHPLSRARLQAHSAEHVPCHLCIRVVGDAARRSYQPADINRIELPTTQGGKTTNLTTPATAGPASPKPMLRRLLPASRLPRLPSGVPRPRTISCGLDHCRFCADIKPSDSLKNDAKTLFETMRRTNVCVNGSLQKRPDSADFHGFAGERNRGRFRKGQWRGVEWGDRIVA